MAFAPEIVHGDWNTVELALRKIMQKLGPVSTPTFGGITVDGSSISSATVGNWNTAFGWGNHADAGYITSVGGGDHSTLDNLDFASAGHTGFQELATNLTSLAGLTFVSTSFVKMTAAGTFALDTNTYYKSGDSPTFANVTDSGITPTHVVFAGTAGLLSGSANFTASATNVTVPQLTIDDPGAGYTHVFGFDNQSFFYIQNTAALQHAQICLYSNEGAGATNVLMQIRGVGTPTSTTNFEQLVFGWLAGSYYQIRSTAGGTGTVRPLNIYCGTYTSQLVLATNGSVGINTSSPSYPLDVSGAARVTGDLYVGNYAIMSGGLEFNLYNTNTINFYCYDGEFEFGNSDGGDVKFTFSSGAVDGVFYWDASIGIFQFEADIRMLGGENLIFSTTTGTKIGTGTSQLLGFYNATPVDQPATVSDAATQDLTGTDTVDKTKLEADLTSVKNAINTLIDRIQELGLIA